MAKVVSSGGKEFWDLTLPVFPKLTNDRRTDVMLVQFAVANFLFSGRSGGADRLEWSKIFSEATKKGGHFDDGIYGAHTRAATRLFEKIAKPPNHDGIFRPVGTRATIFTGAEAGIKFNILNTVLDEQNFVGNRRQMALDNGMNPLLFLELFGKLP